MPNKYPTFFYCELEMTRWILFSWSTLYHDNNWEISIFRPYLDGPLPFAEGRWCRNKSRDSATTFRNIPSSDTGILLENRVMRQVLSKQALLESRYLFQVILDNIIYLYSAGREEHDRDQPYTGRGSRRWNHQCYCSCRGTTQGDYFVLFSNLWMKWKSDHTFIL